MGTEDNKDLKIHHVSMEEKEKWNSNNSGAGMITTDKLADGSVTTPKIEDLAVTNAKIANGTITQTQLANNSVGTNQLINLNVITDKIANNAVTTAKVNDLSITNAKLANTTITGSKLVSGTITQTQMANNSVGTNQISNLSVTGDKIAGNTITATQIANVAVLGSQVALGASAQATGSNAVSIGGSAQATDFRSVALGNGASSQASRGIAIGMGTTVSGNGGVAIGQYTNATHSQSIIMDSQHTNNIRNTTTSNQILLGGSSIITPMAYRALSVLSDERDKSNISNLKYNSLEFINKIEPKQYIYDVRSDYTRWEEIQEDEYVNLDDYTKQHRVRNIPVYSINNKIEFIELDYEVREVDTNQTKIQDRFKTIIKSNVLKSREVAIEKYKSLTTRESSEELINENIKKVRDMRLVRRWMEKDGSKSGKRYHNGFLAQQVKQVADEMGFDFCGFKDHAVNGGDDLYSLTYEEFIAPMIGAIQQLTQEVKELKTKLIND